MNGTGRFKAWRFVHPDLARSETEGVTSAGLQVGPQGRIQMVEDDAAIRQALLLLLTTAPGERVMRPEYGCELRRLVFSPNDETTAGLAIHYVRRAVERWEPRIEIESIDAQRWEPDSEIGQVHAQSGEKGIDEGDGDEPGRLIITFDYRVRATRRQGRIVRSLDLAAEGR